MHTSPAPFKHIIYDLFFSVFGGGGGGGGDGGGGGGGGGGVCECV